MHNQIVFLQHTKHCYIFLQIALKLLVKCYCKAQLENRHLIVIPKIGPNDQSNVCSMFMYTMVYHLNLGVSDLPQRRFITLGRRTKRKLRMKTSLSVRRQPALWVKFIFPNLSLMNQ